MKKILLLLLILKTSVWADLETVDIKTFEQLIKQGVPVIDIRTPEEWERTGIITGAHKITFFDVYGDPHLAEWFFKVGHLLRNEKAPLLIYCASGHRSHKLGKILNKMGFENIYELKGGIHKGWIDFGKDTTPAPEVF